MRWLSRLLSRPRRLFYRWKVKQAKKMLRDLDSLMTKAGVKRHERRRFWREFVRSQVKDAYWR